MKSMPLNRQLSQIVSAVFSLAALSCCIFSSSSFAASPQEKPMSHWPFADSQNVATITLQQIIRGGQPILLVTHDEDDGFWQFLTGAAAEEKDVMVVGLKSVFALDPSIGELADLPLGWKATRIQRGAPWKRAPQ